MKIEHVAFNVEDPISVSRWYVENLGLTIKRQVMEPPWPHFLADDSGTVMLEIYGNADVEVPNYRETDPMVVHIALISTDVNADTDRLTEAGAILIGEIQNLPNGDQMAFLRDPWGFTLQLVKRQESMI